MNGAEPPGERRLPNENELQPRLPHLGKQPDMLHHLVAQAVRIIDQHDRERVYRLERDEEVLAVPRRDLCAKRAPAFRGRSASTTPKPINIVSRRSATDATGHARYEVSVR